MSQVPARRRTRRAAFAHPYWLLRGSAGLVALVGLLFGLLPPASWRVTQVCRSIS